MAGVRVVRAMLSVYALRRPRVGRSEWRVMMILVHQGMAS
jgi:hypothetical protein